MVRLGQSAVPAEARAANQRSVLLSGPVWPTLLRLATPNMIGVLIQSMIGIVDAWFLGQLGRTALAGVALVFPLFMLQNMLSAGAIGGAVAGATARALGAGDQARAEAVLRAAIVIAFGGSAAMAVLFLGFGSAIYGFLGGSGAVLQAALAYSDVLFAGVVALWLFNMLSSVLRGLGDTLRPALGLALVTAVHLPLAWLLIGGAGPVPGLGMRGGALAIVLAYAIGTVALFVYMLGRHAPLRLRVRKVSWALLQQILRPGIFAGSQSVLTIASFLLITAMLGRFGEAALAGYGIGARIEILMIPIIFGFGGASIAMVGASVGAGDRDRAIGIAWRGSFASALLVGGIGLFLAIFPSVWAELFTDDAEVASVTRHYLQIVGPCYAFFGLGLSAYFSSQGLGSLFYPVLAAWLRFVLIAIGFAMLVLADYFNATAAFGVVAFAMVAYGSFVGIALYLGPWRRVAGDR